MKTENRETALKWWRSLSIDKQNSLMKAYYPEVGWYFTHSASEDRDRLLEKIYCSEHV